MDAVQNVVIRSPKNLQDLACGIKFRLNLNTQFVTDRSKQLDTDLLMSITGFSVPRLNASRPGNHVDDTTVCWNNDCRFLHLTSKNLPRKDVGRLQQLRFDVHRHIVRDARQ